MPFSFFTKKSNSFTGNVLKLVTGATLAQALGFLISPLITRLFAPEAYGISALFLSIASIIGVIVCLRYDSVIMLPQTHEEAANIFIVSLLSVLLITTLSTLIIVWGSDLIIHLIKAPELKKYLWLMPFAIFFLGIASTLTCWNSRKKSFGRLSVVQIVSSVVTQTTKLSAGIAGFVSGGVLIVTPMLGNVASSVALASQIWREDKKLFLNSIRWKRILRGFVRYRKFPMIDTWGRLLNTISWQMPALMLPAFFPLSVVGLYALGLTVIKTPLSIIAGALSQVFYQKACDEKNAEGSNGELVENLMDKMMFVGTLPTAILSMVGEELFAVVFGARWAEAGRYTQILAPWIFFWFISSPLSALFSVYERQGAALSAHALIFSTRIISLYIGGIYQNIYLALGLFSATGIIAYAFVAAWNIRMAQANGKRIFLSFLKYGFYTLPVFLLLFILKYIFQFGTIVLLLSGFLIVIFYLIMFRSKIISLFSTVNLS